VEAPLPTRRAPIWHFRADTSVRLIPSSRTSATGSESFHTLARVKKRASSMEPTCTACAADTLSVCAAGVATWWTRLVGVVIEEAVFGFGAGNAAHILLRCFAMLFIFIFKRIRIHNIFAWSTVDNSILRQLGLSRGGLLSIKYTPSDVTLYLKLAWAEGGLVRGDVTWSVDCTWLS
jgi:hypothetical protein